MTFLVRIYASPSLPSSLIVKPFESTSLSSHPGSSLPTLAVKSFSGYLNNVTAPISVIFELEASLDVDGLTISDGEDVRVKAAENVEGRQAHQPFHLIRDPLPDAFVLCDHGGVRQDCRLREPAGPARGEVGRGSCFRR